MFRSLRASDVKSRASAVGTVIAVLLGLFGGMGGAPLFAAFIAAASGQHQVGLGVDEEHFRILLRHDAASAERSVSHTHTRGSQAALALGEMERLPNGDHVLHFDRFEEGTRVNLRAAAGQTVSVPTAIVVGHLPSRLLPPKFVRSRSDAGWPVDQGTGMALGRSTVRLI